MDLRTLQRALGGEISNGQLLCPGPGHSAADRSLSIKLDPGAPDGFIVNSFAADDAIVCKDHVRTKLGLPAFKPNGQRRRRASPEAVEAAVMAAARMVDGDATKRRPIATYNYTTAEGTLLYQVLRLQPKDFRQRRPDGNGGWIWKLDDVRRVLYRWPELLEYPDATVFVTEGEADADRVASLRHCATTVASGKWTDECVKALDGRDVIILEDNDEAGREKALAAAQALHGTAKTIRIVLLPDLPDKGDVSDWLDADPCHAHKLVDVCFEAPIWTPSSPRPPPPPSPPSSSGWKYYAGEAPAAPRWLIKRILPETGAALMSGQWGTYKTTIATEMSVCVMAGIAFAGRYHVKRRGAVLYFALEGESMIAARLSAVASHLGVTGALPFAWRGDCPPLMSDDAVDKLCAIVNEAAADLDRRFGLPVALIWLDTVITAASFASGEDNDAAAAQKIMTALRRLSAYTNALAVGVDHFGKVVETGTRGSSAKEAAADTVIALLADRELNGGVKNTRLAVRKQRDGVSGFEIPFTARMTENGTDDDGDPITGAPVIHWQAAAQAMQADDARWTKSMQLLRRILMTTLADSGKNVRPFLDGPDVRACDVELVRAEFYRQHPADGTEKQKANARRQAFSRALRGAQATGLVAVREADGIQLVWLTRPGT